MNRHSWYSICLAGLGMCIAGAVGGFASIFWGGCTGMRDEAFAAWVGCVGVMILGITTIFVSFVADNWCETDNNDSLTFLHIQDLVYCVEKQMVFHHFTLDRASDPPTVKTSDGYFGKLKTWVGIPKCTFMRMVAGCGKEGYLVWNHLAMPIDFVKDARLIFLDGNPRLAIYDPKTNLLYSGGMCEDKHPVPATFTCDSVVYRQTQQPIHVRWERLANDACRGWFCDNWGFVDVPVEVLGGYGVQTSTDNDGTIRHAVEYQGTVYKGPLLPHSIAVERMSSKASETV